jgi:hypothetical protein
MDALCDFGLQANLIAKDLVSKLGLEVHYHHCSCPMEWENKNVEFRVTDQCKLIITTSANYIEKVEVDLLLLGVCG